MERALRIRKESPELGWGHCELLDVGDSAVFATQLEWENRTMVCVHNLATTEREVAVDRPDDATALTDVFSDSDYEPLDERATFMLRASGYRWIKVRRSDTSMQLL